MKAQNLLLHWLTRRLEPISQSWLEEHCVQLSAPESSDKILYQAFGQALRYAGKAPLALDAGEQAQAFAFHPGWDLRDWTCDQAARAAILTSLPGGAKTVERILSLFQTADLGEHIALARSLFLLPDAKALMHIAREAIRSNMRDVFEAMSQQNPYPAEHCDEIAWNQMVVKCLFVDLPLGTIYGLDQRANAELCRILFGLARERHAAKRTLSQETWRCVAPFLNEKEGAEFMSLVENGNSNWEKKDA